MTCPDEDVPLQPQLTAYAGIPYQVFGERSGALALMIAWSRLAMTNQKGQQGPGRALARRRCEVRNTGRLTAVLPEAVRSAC
jgi:hypothetical protein